MISNTEITHTNTHRLADWHAKGGPEKALDAERSVSRDARVRMLQTERSRHLLAIASITEELQAMGVE